MYTNQSKQTNNSVLQKAISLFSISVSASFLALTVTLPATAMDKTTITQEQQQVMGLQTKVIKQVADYPLLNVIGEVIFPLDKRHQLSTPVSGKLIAIYHMHGEIGQGQKFAEIQSTEWIQMQADLVNTQVELEAAQQELKRAKALSNSGASSIKQLNQARVAVNKWQALQTTQISNLQSLGMSDDGIKELLSKQHISTANFVMTVPAAGVLYDLRVQLNEEVSKGQALAKLGETDVMVVDAPVPVQIAMQLQEGQRVYLPTLQQQAMISHIHHQVDAMTQTVDIHIQVVNENHRLKDGLSVPVEILQKASKSTYKVDALAISKLDGQMVIFAVQGEQVYALPVEVLSVAAGQAFITLPETGSVSLQNVVVSGTAAVKAAFSAEEAE